MKKLSEVKYLGDLRTELRHLKSEEIVITDAPTDNNGKGEAFSPTDLVATALLSCMITMMGIYAKKNGLKLDGVKGDVVKEMANNPRRISKIIVEMDMKSTSLSAKERKILENIAVNCPVAKSLNSEIGITMKFNY